MVYAYIFNIRTICKQLNKWQGKCWQIIICCKSERKIKPRTKQKKIRIFCNNKKYFSSYFFVSFCCSVDCFCDCSVLLWLALHAGSGVKGPGEERKKNFRQMKDVKMWTKLFSPYDPFHLSDNSRSVGQQREQEKRRKVSMENERILESLKERKKEGETITRAKLGSL